MEGGRYFSFLSESFLFSSSFALLGRLIATNDGSSLVKGEQRRRRKIKEDCYAARYILYIRMVTRILYIRAFFHTYFFTQALAMLSIVLLVVVRTVR